MPRLQNPSKPIFIISKKIKNKNWYFLISENSYIYHHIDKKWRIRCLVNPLSYLFKLRRDAIILRELFMKQEFEYLPYGVK